jgi:hypothetical protein
MDIITEKMEKIELVPKIEILEQPPLTAKLDPQIQGRCLF